MPNKSTPVLLRVIVLGAGHVQFKTRYYHLASLKMLWCLFICHNTCECVLDGYLIVDLNNNIIMEFIYNLVLKNGPYRYLKKYTVTLIYTVCREFFFYTQ